MAEQQPEEYSVSELAAILNVPELTLRQLVTQGMLRSFLKGDEVYFRTRDVEEFLQGPGDIWGLRLPGSETRGI